MALVDIVIPNYQYGRYLRQCVASVVTQGVEDIRILIIDNASTDDSVEIAQYLSAQDPRIEVKARSMNLGAHASFNDGVDWAESDYFMILCADDLLPSGALSRAVAIMEKYPEVSFSYGTCAEYREEEEFPSVTDMKDTVWSIESGTEFIYRSCRKLPYIMAPLVRTRVQKKAGYYRPGLPFNDDVEILLRLACYGDAASTKAVQAIQRLHPANVSNAVWKDPIRGVLNDADLFDSFFRNEGKQLPGSKRLHKLARRNAGDRAYWRAMALFMRGQYPIASGLLKCAFRLSPWAAVFPPLSYLARIDQPFRRIDKVLSQSLGLKRAMRYRPHFPLSRGGTRSSNR
jgi:glycosyltransferase involved in cell wall biosynthesis